MSCFAKSKNSCPTNKITYTWTYFNGGGNSIPACPVGDYSWMCGMDQEGTYCQHGKKTYKCLDYVQGETDRVFGDGIYTGRWREVQEGVPPEKWYTKGCVCTLSGLIVPCVTADVGSWAPKMNQNEWYKYVKNCPGVIKNCPGWNIKVPTDVRAGQFCYQNGILYQAQQCVKGGSDDGRWVEVYPQSGKTGGTCPI